jgi:16S rRNA (adenine1518-N6/adenine1519-N6)-dimethyltransferase
MSTGSSQNQTLSFLMRRFSEVGIKPRISLGQNFLVDLNLIRLLLKSAELGPADVVLEVGTGTGSLTALMGPLVAAVVTVELDRQLFSLAEEELAGLENVTLLGLDALAGKNRLNPEVVAAVQEKLAAAPGRQFKLVANLPYNVATPLVSNLLALERPPEAMTVTIQKEMADRILARPGTKDYGPLSLWVQSQCAVELVRVMPPSVFWPRPKVSSAIVRIVLQPERRAAIGDLEFFHSFVRAVFLHRRKVLRSELATVFKDRLDKPAVDQILRAENLSPEARAEQLGADQMLSLARAVRAQLGD